MLRKLFIPLLICTFSYGNGEVLNDSLYLHHHVATIRRTETNRAQFRQSLKKIGEYLAIESMSELETATTNIETPLGTAPHLVCTEEPVLVTILRAGMPLLEGVQEVYPNATVGFFAMARNEKTFVPEVGYIGVPDVQDKCVILVDTMVGTAGSANAAIEDLKKRGAKKIIFLCVMISSEGFENLDPQVKVIAAAVDPILNEKKYLVPGLGDAGDRSYGPKK